jgi:aminopeptidase N
MAYQTLATLKPNENIWKRFYQAIKPAAYGIDSTPGTTPIYQEIPNLKDAKSAYGAIVYSKAPGVLKQLAFVLGDDKFRDGLRLYLKDHAYANAEWSDLVGAFEKVSETKLGDWADAYIKRRGMPQVDVEWTCDPATTITSVVLKQHDVLNEGGVWPIATQILMKRQRAESVLRQEWLGYRTIFVASDSAGCPKWIFVNDEDHAYGRFLLDPVSRKAVIAEIGSISDVFQRTLLWGSLWDSVREAEMDPREYVDLALKSLPAEKDEALAQSIIGRTVFALHKYVNDEARMPLVAKMEALAHERMLNAPEKDMRIVWFRALRSVAETEKGRGWIKDILAGKLAVPGVEVRPLDRWQMITGLVALKDPEAEALLAAEEKRDPSGEGRKYAYVANAARASAEAKKEYFDGYMKDASRPEDWVEQSLGAFNSWNQSSITLPYLKPALDALPQVKKERKIFFVLAWLNAFIGGQQSAEAQAQVQEFLKSAALDKDLKLKVLEVFDDLNRTVKIRAKYGAKAKE